MHIVIDSIDKESFELRGFTPQPSFRIRFTSSTFAGIARLVPFSGLADAKPGDEFDVEIAQESVSEFRLSEPSGIVGVEPLLMPGDFKVRGIVRFVSPPSEPAGNWDIYVQVGGADFVLPLQNPAILRPDVGAEVEFVVHDLSLWDESL